VTDYQQEELRDRCPDLVVDSLALGMVAATMRPSLAQHSTVDRQTAHCLWEQIERPQLPR
jgi:hypothetical protein